ncbi:hypothetical protein CVT24_000214 [Panaeolus cyanescens]|uniref:Uncharacterized protein n=1 Tax=Panaeolus cyanescens TaxID=181874 RepID=A0A409XBW0_9AGAR|nr:hypothetical protein CVT24_000214 [Panaeolus cyanescens]
MQHTLQEIASRHTLLVSFNFGVYRSPAPSAFLRTSPSCHPDFISQPFSKPKANVTRHLSKCVHFIAKEKIGYGATGTVYRGTIQLWTDSGDTVEENAVIKIPFGTICTPSGHLSDNKEPYAYRIQDEYCKYEKIFRGGVRFGVPKVHGVFQDVETGTIALFMQDVGMDLLRRERTVFGKPKSYQITLSEVELYVVPRPLCLGFL